MKTPGGPSAKTMDVINGATDILNEMNKLRCPLPQWDWSPEIDWWPGDPIGVEPVIEYSFLDVNNESVDVMGIPHSNDGEGGGQHIRPMIEEYDLDDDFKFTEIIMDCDECEVAGAPMATSCWFCGKSLPGLWRPSRDNWFDPDYSYVEGPEGWVYDPWAPVLYSSNPGDPIEDFRADSWENANNFNDEMALASWRAFSEPLDMTPWQERFLMEYSKADVEFTQQLMAHGNVSREGRVRTFLQMPRRNSGLAYLQRMQAQLDEFFSESKVINMETLPPTNVQIQESRRRPVQPQRTYPTSSNPTQERRRRNH